MKPMPKAAFSPRTITAAAGIALALALALTGCGSGGKDEPQKNDEAAQTQKSDDGGGMQGKSATSESASAPAPDSSTPADSEPSESKSEDPFADSATTTNWASDDSMKVDKKGNGTVPARSIEADLVDLFENKLDMKVKKAKCASDMDLTEWYGFETCDVTVEDKKAPDNEKTYFGTVKIVDHKDKMIKYKLKFPGINKKDFDFKD